MATLGKEIAGVDAEAFPIKDIDPTAIVPRRCRQATIEANTLLGCALLKLAYGSSATSDQGLITSAM
jgi:hypothetical protein